MFEHRPFGSYLKLTVRGASHAPALGFELDNFPAGFRPDLEALRAFMARRAPGRDVLSTARQESDEIEFLSGFTDGLTDGTRLSGRILNQDFRPHDYGSERTVPRPGHADFGQWVEQGRIPTGGGANSGRLTAALCAAGGLCLQVLSRRGISVSAVVDSVGGRTEGFEETIAAARDEGDSVGGTIRCEAIGLPAGLGGALFAGLESALSAALFAIPGVKGLEFGNGFAASCLKGSENDDAFVFEDGAVRTESNRHGGILGGRTSGMPLVFRLAMKPTPTVFKPLKSVDLLTGESVPCAMKGRHDPCIVRRAVPVVEALTAFVLLDALLDAEHATPRLCLTLTGRTLRDDLAQYVACRAFTDMLELRVDLLDASERARAAEFPAMVPVPVLLTFRRASDGGSFDGSENERIDFFSRVLAASSKKRFAFVDFEDDFREPRLIALAGEKGVRIVRSRHDFKGTPEELEGLCRRMVAGTDEIVKLALTPRNVDDLLRLFAAGRALDDVPHVLCSMGAVGRASRTLAVRSASCWTYSSAGDLADLGHLTPYELVRTYRQRVQTDHFTLFGVTGWPLLKTRSPELHNAAFAAADIDAVMADFPVQTAEEAVRLVSGLGLRGLAVTIPHKESILPLLNRLSPEAKEIGAVNTVSVEKGELVGYNTDADGFAEAFLAFVGRAELKGFRVAVLGAGGASKAVVYALARLGAEVEVFHRTTPPKGFDALVNATPVDPIPDYAFSGAEWVYDLVYVPYETPLLTRARAAGCPAENGLSMLRAQARLQRRIWGME